MPLDSDIADADKHLTVEFFHKKTEPHLGKPYVRIMIPGDQNNIIEQPVNEGHTRRFARQWFAFQMDNAPDTEEYGTPIKKWHEEHPDELSEGQLVELNILKFRTVEQIAQAADKQLQRIGMGGPGLREKAKAYLDRKNQSESSKELQETKSALATLQAQMAELIAQQGKTGKDKVNGLNASSTRSAGNR